MIFFPVEILIFRIIVVISIFDVLFIYLSFVPVDVAGYAGSFCLGILPIAIGQFYRISGRDTRLGHVLTSSGLYVLFTIFASVFNYTFLPIAFSPIDDVLMWADRLVGYNWPDVVTWAAHYPLVGTALYVVYMTSLPQLLVIIMTLGFTGQDKALQGFLLTGTLGALLSIAFWVFFPTFGAKAYHPLPEWVLEAIPLAVSPDYGQELVRLGREGVDYLSLTNILGLIGFPSFHIFMALMSVFFVPRHAFFITVFSVLNILMLPAVLVQGGHHLADVFGGIVCFAVACPISLHIVNKMSGAAAMVRSPQSAIGAAAD